MKVRICDLLFFSSSASIIIIFARFLILRICPPREIREYYQNYSINDDNRHSSKFDYIYFSSERVR